MILIMIITNSNNKKTFTRDSVDKRWFQLQWLQSAGPTSNFSGISRTRCILYILQRGVQWKQGVVIYMRLWFTIQYYSNPLHPPPTAPPSAEYPYPLFESDTLFLECLCCIVFSCSQYTLECLFALYLVVCLPCFFESRDVGHIASVLQAASQRF